MYAQIGESVWYLKPQSKGKDKFNSRWESGIWLGIREESGETFVGTKEGVIKVRTVRRKSSEQDRWNAEEYKEMKGPHNTCTLRL